MSHQVQRKSVIIWNIMHSYVYLLLSFLTIFLRVLYQASFWIQNKLRRMSFSFLNQLLGCSYQWTPLLPAKVLHKHKKTHCLQVMLLRPTHSRGSLLSCRAEKWCVCNYGSETIEDDFRYLSDIVLYSHIIIAYSFSIQEWTSSLIQTLYVLIKCHDFALWSH